MRGDSGGDKREATGVNVSDWQNMREEGSGGKELSSIGDEELGMIICQSARRWLRGGCNFALQGELPPQVTGPNPSTSPLKTVESA